MEKTKNLLARIRHKIGSKTKSLWRFFKSVILHFNKNNGFILASSMVYSTLFSIVPFFASITALFSRYNFINLDWTRSWIQEKILPQIVPSNHVAFIEVLEGFIHNAATFSWISFGVFLFSTTLLIKKIIDSFNLIYQASPPKKLVVTRLASYFSSVIIGILIVGLTLTLTQPIFIWLAEIQLLPDTKLHFFFTNKITPWLFLSSILLFIFKTTPSTYIEWKSAFLATLLTCVGWFLTNFIFTNVINYVFNYEKIYGSLASIFFFLIWLYLLWIILFFALEVSYVHQYKQRPIGTSPSKKIATAITLLIYLQTQYEKNNRPIPFKHITRDLQIPSRELSTQLHLFISHDLIKQKRYLFPLFIPLKNFKEENLVDILKIEMGAIPDTEGGLITQEIFNRIEAEIERLTIEEISPS